MAVMDANGLSQTNPTLSIDIHDTKSYHKTHNHFINSNKQETIVNETVCWKPSAIAILEVYATVDTNPSENTNEAANNQIGKFYFSPLELGSFTRNILINSKYNKYITKNVSVDFDITFVSQSVDNNNDRNNNNYNNGNQQPSDPSSPASPGAGKIHSTPDASLMRVLPETQSWKGYSNQVLTMKVEAINLGNCPTWRIYNPDPSLNITIIPQQSCSTGGDYGNYGDDAASTPKKLDSTNPWDDNRVEPTRSIAILKCIPSVMTRNEFILIGKHETLTNEVAVEIEIDIKNPSSNSNGASGTNTSPNDDASSVVSQRGGISQGSKSQQANHHHHNHNHNHNTKYNNKSENLWVLWWVLITIGFTLIVACSTFYCLKKAQKFPKHPNFHSIQMYHHKKRNSDKVCVDS